MKRYTSFLFCILIFILMINVGTARSQVRVTLPKIEIGEKGNGEANLSTGIQIVILLTALSLAPAFLLMLTSFTRLIVVLSFVRSALSIQQTPPNQVLIGIALFLTFFIMAPTWKIINSDAISPYMAGKISYKEAIDKGSKPIREFMFRQTKEKELAMMVQIAKINKPRNHNDIPTHILIPAFMVSELNIAFKMGFMIFIPFIVIDMVISSILMSMGMMMLPPMMISLPFKILLFVLADGWNLIIKSLITSFN